MNKQSIKIPEHFKPLNENCVSAMVKSISKYGLIFPIIVQSKNGQYTLRDGHYRLAALKVLGVTEIPAYDVTTKKKVTINVAE